MITNDNNDNSDRLKNKTNFYCEKCNYYTCNKKDYLKHCLTKKHLRGQMITNDNKKSQKSPDEGSLEKNERFVCPHCNKSYKFKSGISRHRKTCMQSNLDQITSLQKQNEDILNILKETTNKNAMLCEKIVNDNASKVINATINNNQKVNFNVFLNTQCKDAMSINDFVNSLQLTFDDLIYTKNYGYVKGITNIFVKNLEDLDATSRPIQCSDQKKQQFYVKNENDWVEDSKHMKLNKTIDTVAKKQINKIKEWQENNPDWHSTEEGIEEYMKIIQTAMGGKDDSEREKNNNVIKTNLSEAVAIDDKLQIVK
tara:strand:+ start:251 stop:1186 length:936 start_codon:yes stop_codon:yes gene_type:complete